MSSQIRYEIDGRQVIIPLEGKELTIGREPSNDLVIGRPYVSRWHARIYKTRDGWRVKDLESKCGIQINDKETVDGALAHGDRIIIKEMCLTFLEEDGTVPALSAVSGVSLTPSEADPRTVFRPAVDFAELGSIAPDVSKLQRLLKMVSETSRTLLESSDLDETFVSVLDIVFEALPVQRGCIMLWDEAEQGLVAKCVKNNLGSGDSTIHFSRTIAEKVYRERVSVMTTDAQVDKFIGDCLMAVFGAPIASEDHVRQAADAALQMRQALGQLNDALPVEKALRFRVGIHSGKVVPGDIGSVRRRRLHGPGRHGEPRRSYRIRRRPARSNRDLRCYEGGLAGEVYHEICRRSGAQGHFT